MLNILAALGRARAARPLLWWVLALLVYVVAPVPQEWLLLLIVGLGTALAVTVSRMREGGRELGQHTRRGWVLAERLTNAAEDRIRGGGPHPQQTLPPQLPAGPSYDPGALLGAVVTVLAAEGIPTAAAAGLPACVQLLAWQNIVSCPGVPAPAADTLIGTVRPGPRRPYRVMPPGLLAHLVRVVLTLDHVLPETISVAAAQDLIEASVQLLHALGITPDNHTVDLGEWPVIAQILDVTTGR